MRWINTPITHNFITLDACDDPTAWIPIGDGAVSLNTTNYKQGIGAINIYKQATTQAIFGAEKTIPATDFENKVFAFWVYVDSNSTLNKLSIARIYLFDSAGNYHYWDLRLKVGWNKFTIIPNKIVERDSNYVLEELHLYNREDGASAIAPDLKSITKIRIYFETKSVTDTIAEGSLVIDYLSLGLRITQNGGVST